MSLRLRYQRILCAIGPAGAVGAAIVLGSAVPSAADQEPASAQPSAAGPRVSERLAAIREAVSAAADTQPQAAKSGDLRLAWGNWWRNWGWRRPWGNIGIGVPWGNFGYYRPWNNWHNWHNWHNYWRNW